MQANQLELIQDIQKKILQEVHEFCILHNINYQIWAGTLIGAVRHNGFIPWDDDIDILMLREDYDKFCSLFKNNFSSEYFLQNRSTEKNYEYNYAKVRKNFTLALEKSHSEEDMHHGIWIDIFPLDALPNNSLRKAIFINKLHLLDIITTSQMAGKSSADNGIKESLRNILITMTSMRSKEWWIEKNSQAHKKYNKEGNLQFSAFSWSGNKKEVIKYLQDKKLYSDSINYNFEDITVLGPRNHDKILTDIYGDYSKPVPLSERTEGHSLIDFSPSTKNKKGI